MTQFENVDKDTLILALIHKLGGTASLTKKDLNHGAAGAAITNLETGTIHLELLATPPTPAQHFLAPSPPEPAATSSDPQRDQADYDVAMPADG